MRGKMNIGVLVLLVPTVASIYVAVTSKVYLLFVATGVLIALLIWFDRYSSKKEEVSRDKS